MGANSIGTALIVTFFGESHGKCVGAILDGCPSGLALSAEDVQAELDKRIPSDPEIVSPRREKDVVEFLSGIFHGFTTGAPICLLVWNHEAISEEYVRIRDTPRPGHADYPARVKYGNFNDYRGGGRFSGRITAAFVMAGAIAKKLLRLVGVEVLAYTLAIANVELPTKPTLPELRDNTYKSPVRCPNPQISNEMKQAILNAKTEGDSVGGIVECIALNVPVGVGAPLFDSLDADLAKILFDIPAVKGVEFGAGFEAAKLTGSENNDPFIIQNGRIVTTTNNAGGVLGGLSSGMPLTVRVAIKPTPSISQKQRTVDVSRMQETSIQVKGRHDPCIVPKAVPVIESAVAIMLTDHLLQAGIISQRVGG